MDIFKGLSLIILLQVSTINGTLFDKILQSFDDNGNAGQNCVLIIKAGGSIPFEEFPSVPTIIMDVTKNQTHNVKKNADLIGGHYGNEMKRVSKYMGSFDNFEVKIFFFCTILQKFSKCEVKA